MNIIIREGSAAKNFDALIPLFSSHPGKLMFGSDDKHPDDLLLGHINNVVSRAINLGYDFFDVLHAACVLPVQHYNMNVGLLQPGHSADFIIVDNLDTMHVTQTWIEGVCVFNGNVLFEKTAVTPINYFVDWQTVPSDFQLKASGKTKIIPVIDALDGELITKRSEATLQVENNLVLADQANDILKITVVNRYAKVPPAVGFIRNFGLKNGAIASSVGHDSHNIIAVGSSDEYLSKVVNLIMDAKGGIAAVHEKDSKLLPLPVAGIMTHLDGTQAGKDYEALNIMAKAMGSTLGAPFMLISFMALLVIPSIKMSDKGLFDAERFEFISF
jgi:adenine deaminase